MRKYHFLIITSLFFAIISVGKAQVGINTNEPKSTFEIRKIENSNQPQGLLLPSLTNDEINNMRNPTEGLMVYNIDEHCVYIYKIDGGIALWKCVEFNKQTFAITYMGATGAWVKKLETTDANTVKFKVTNNLDVPINGVNLNNAVTLPNVPIGSYTITPLGGSSAYSSVNFPPGSSREFTYKITNFTPDFVGDLTVKFATLGREVLGNIIVQDESSTRAIEIIFNGDYIANKSLDANNTITLKIQNYSNTARTNVDLSNAVSLSFPPGGISIDSGQHTNVTIPQNGAVSLVYTLSGTPLTSGNINATFVPNAKVAGAVSSHQTVSNPQASTVSVKTMTIDGIYVEGTAVNNSNYVNVTLKNDNNFPLEHFDLSKALTFNVSSGVSIAAGQHTDVSINANGTITLKYKLTGTPSGSSLEATWNYGAFGAITKTEPIKTQLRVQPDFLADVNANGIYSQVVNIYPGAGNDWSVMNIAQLPSWVEIDTPSGTGQTAITIKLKEHTTSEIKITDIIVKRNLDGAIGKITVTKPATNELIVSSFNTKFSINGETKTITVTNDTSSSIGSLIEVPDWVESVKLNEPSGTLIIKTKPRTTEGPEITGNLVFTYGPGGSYVYRKNDIKLRPKAQLCPDNPIHFLLTPYYRIKYLDDDSVINVRLASKSGVSDFSTYGPHSSSVNLRSNTTFDEGIFKLQDNWNRQISKEVVQNGTIESTLFARLEFNTFFFNVWGTYSYGINNYQQDTYKAKVSLVYHRQKDISPSDSNQFNLKKMYLDDLRDYINRGNNFITVYERDANGTGGYKYYSINNMPANLIKVCICTDGGDENTTNKP